MVVALHGREWGGGGGGGDQEHNTTTILVLVCHNAVCYEHVISLNPGIRLQATLSLVTGTFPFCHVHLMRESYITTCNSYKRLQLCSISHNFYWMKT